MGLGDETRVSIVLLAAIYASAIPFSARDASVHAESNHLYTAFKGSPTDALWDLVYDLVLQNAHQPKLAVVSAALLFMKRSPVARAQGRDENPADRRRAAAAP